MTAPHDQPMCPACNVRRIERPASLFGVEFYFKGCSCQQQAFALLVLRKLAENKMVRLPQPAVEDQPFLITSSELPPEINKVSAFIDALPPEQQELLAQALEAKAQQRGDTHDAAGGSEVA